MKRNDIKELHTKTDAELKKLLKDAQDMVLSLKLDLEQARLKNTSALTLKRKEIAVLKTIMRAKEEKK
jgi:ribosomal protein L29